MKTRSKILMSYLMTALMLSSGLLFYSCESEDEVGGVPGIERIRPIDPEMADESLESVGLGENVAIVGENLKSVKEVYVNGYKTFFSPTMVTETHLLFTISDETPTIATSQDVPNEIRLVSGDGEVSYSINVLPPPPVVNTISNEMAKAGETLTITGKYFFFLEEVVFPGGVVATDLEHSANGAMMTVTVPDNISQAGTIQVTSESGSGTLSPMYRFNDPTGIFNDFDDLNFFAAWGPKPVLGNSDPAPIDGNYVRVTGTDVPAPMWWNNDQVVPFGGFTWPVTSGDASEYAVKFEMNTPIAWNSGWFEWNLGWTFFYRLKPWDVNPGEEYWNVSGTRTPTPENQWITVVIPLNKFRLKPGNFPDGTPMATLSELEGKDMTMAFQNPGEEDGGIPIEEFHLCMDNFRLVKITE
jgi:hypothetical protein